MALTKTAVNDKIEVITINGYKAVQVRAATIISEDGVELSRKFNRHVVMPDADLSAEDADVAEICTPVFTDAVKAAYAAHLAAQGE